MARYVNGEVFFLLKRKKRPRDEFRSRSQAYVTS
jgi:hypothetical protein